MHDPQKILLLNHEQGLRISRRWPRSTRISCSTIHRISTARVKSRRRATRCPWYFVSKSEVPCYEDLRRSGKLRTNEYIKAGLEAEFDKFTIDGRNQHAASLRSPWRAACNPETALTSE